MKRIIATLLLMVMLATIMTGCGFDPDDKGSIIPMLIGAEQTNYDPTALMYNRDTIKYVGLVFQGLTVMTSDGKIEPGLAKSWYTKNDDRRGEYYLYFELCDSKWSDGRKLLADHFIYAWKRLLSPETQNPAACLLYDIKNAKEVKAGNMSIDSLGIAAVDNLLIEVQFEKKIDVELFLEAVSSPALCPMRDDVIIGKEDVWATSMEDATFNGEFAIKTMNKHGELDIDKSSNYKATEEEVSPIKYVKPYKLIVDFSKDLASQLKMFNDSEIYYIGQLSKSDYAANESKLTKQPLLSTLTVYFNTKNASLAKADARKALSTAVDRNGLAELIGLGTKPATGFITEGFYDSSLGSNFRKAGGDLISASADSSKAKSLASSGGLTGSLKLTYLKSDDNDAIASKLINDWKAAGINVTADAQNESSYVKAIKEGTFDMLLIEYQGLSTNAASVLAPYARKYSGESVSVADDSVGYTPHITGFESDAYDAAIDSVFEAVTRGERATALHAAEELLVNEMPAAPLAFFYDYYMASSELSGLRSSAYGYRLFTNVVLKDYKEKNAAYEAKNAENGSEA